MNIKSLIGKKIAVHCDTEEKAKAFLKECEKAGVEWCSGYKPTIHTNWQSYGADTCYDFWVNNDKLGFARINWFKSKNYEIIEYTPDKATENYQLQIKQKKNKVIAILKDDNGNYIRHANAVCSDDDTFDYEIGKQIALSRLFTKIEVVREVKRPAKVGEYIKIINDIDANDCYKIGDIFSVAEDCSGGVYIKTEKQNISCSRNNKYNRSFLWTFEYVVLENYKEN